MTAETKEARCDRMELEIIGLEADFERAAGADIFRIGLALDMRRNSLNYVRDLSRREYEIADLDTRVIAK